MDKMTPKKFGRFELWLRGGEQLYTRDSYIMQRWVDLIDRPQWYWKITVSIIITIEAIFGAFLEG